jgi:2-deoxy-scyllo-inosamine dehydrogenase (SAM-dependent)/8-amino-3,8-dideoxy-alpha-D-manno-octulosonate transaminase
MSLPRSAEIYLCLRRFIPRERLMPAITLYQKVRNRVKYGDQNFPRSLAIEVTTRCNRTCYYCPQSVDRLKPRRIESKLYLRILERIQEIRWNGPLDFHFYNEPLLEKDLESLVKIARTVCPKAIPRIFSNGDLLTEERMGSLIGAGVVNFNIARHPPYQEEWDRRIEHLATQYPQYLQWTCIEETPLSNRTGLVKPQQVQNLEAGCFAPSVNLHIDIEGQYLYCCCDYLREHLLGNVRENSIVEAWNNPFYKKVRLEVNKGNPTLDICRACFGREKTSPAENGC